MAFAPLYPDERELHHQLRDALNQSLSNKNFFVWINITPSGVRHGFENLGRIVSGIEWWLDTLDPDALSGDEEILLEDAAAEVRIRALPKKPEARSRRAAQIVGNPEPVVVGWT